MSIIKLLSSAEQSGYLCRVNILSGVEIIAFWSPDFTGADHYPELTIRVVNANKGEWSVMDSATHKFRRGVTVSYKEVISWFEQNAK